MSQDGLSSIETTIILIAFVTLAAIFGYAVLTTGLLTAESSRKSALDALEEATATLTLRGPVVGIANPGKTALEMVRFQIVNAARGTHGVDLDSERTYVTFIDEDQAVRLTQDDWTAVWQTGFGRLLNPGESVQITVNLQSLDPPLTPGRRFALQFSPNLGVALKFKRSVPLELADFMDLP